MTRCRACGREWDGGAACPSCGTPAILESPAEEMPTRTLSPGGTLPPDKEEPGIRPGTILAGRYRVLDTVGRGGMGKVYRAEDLKLDQVVALKFLPEGLPREDRALSRLLGEVRNARQVSHPNVCRVHDIGEAAGVHFLSMEYIDGENLASILARKGRLPIDTALSIARQLCAGLAAAHERGVLHRDLKPSNVLVDGRGVARIADFGLAEASALLRGAKAREGTPFYMSPEQLAGEEVSPRSDLYALGLILYEMIAGRPAYPGGSLEELLRLRRQLPPSLADLAPGLDPAVERLVMQCLQNDPAERPSSARELAAALPGPAPLAAVVEAAQQRADRIAAFRAELGDLRSARVLRLGEEELAALEKYHAGILRDLVRAFEVDLGERGKHLSLGMRIVSLIGALAFAASLIYFFHRIWGVISLPIQAGVLIAAPAGALLATALLAARERAGYFATMAGMLALAGLVLDTTILSTVFNMPFSSWQLLAWGLFALILAYGYRLRMMLGAGLLALTVFLGALLLGAAGIPWFDCLERWEPLLPAGVLALFLPALLKHGAHPGFPRVYRIFGEIFVFGPVILLAVGVQASFIPLEEEKVRVLYQVAGFAASAGAIWLGIARRRKETAYGGGVAFVGLMYAVLAYWYWDLMPKYLFFLLVGVIAVLVLLVQKRLRAALIAEAGEGAP